MDILIIGQSNASNWFDGQSFSSPHSGAVAWSGAWRPLRGEGSIAFGDSLADATGGPVRLLNAAEGATSLLPLKGANWLATGSSSLYGKMLTDVRASGLHPDAVVWIQGEQDAGARVGSAAYAAALDTLFDRIAGDFGSIPVIVQPLILPQTGKDAIVAGQHAFVDSHSNARLLSTGVELPGKDSLHFSTVSYSALGDLMAREVLSALGHPSPDPVIYGSGSRDVLGGSQGADRMYAGAGDDSVRGNAGNDVLIGEQGADRLTAGDGNDLVGGGSGNDTLEGGAGSDLLTGDAGRDSFIFGSAPSGGADLITDFAPGTDKLAFDPTIYDLNHLRYNSANGNLMYEGQLVVTLQGAPKIGAGDLTNEMPGPEPSGGGEEGDAMSGAIAAAGAALGLIAWFF